MKVAVLNSSKEITEILMEVLSDEGFDTCTEFTYHFKKNLKEFDNFIKTNRPSVIVYDISLPYEENYQLFQFMTSRKSAKNIHFVLTTTNKTVLENLVGPTNAYEIIGKPYDLSMVIDIVRNTEKSSANQLSPV